MATVPHHHVAIVGTGFGGIGAAVKLMEDGVEDVVLFERADTVGGVWRDNTYPGAACDVQAHLYAFSFAPNPDWRFRYARQPEIRAYLEDVADRFGVTERVRFGHDVTEAAWDEAAACWRIATSGGDVTADVLVAAPGALAEPRLPPISGLDTFEGDVMHTARWDPEVEVEGRDVAVVGTGASAIQVVPEVQKAAGTLTLYQRTPPWVIPRRDAPIRLATRDRFREQPTAQQALRRKLCQYHEANGLAFRHPWLGLAAERLLARPHLAKQVADPALRRLLTPAYRIGCKRILLSDDYYPALTQPNVTVVDGALAQVRERETVGADGVARPTDVIVFATGFYATEMPFGARVVGRGGARLSEEWGGRPVAHLGTTVAGFPNLFLIQGPNTGLGHSSVVLMAEAQIGHVVNAVRAMRERRLAAVEPTRTAQAAWVAEVDAMAEGTVWTSGCASWYLDATGRNAAIWPGSVPAFQKRVAPFDPNDYRFRPLGPGPLGRDGAEALGRLPAARPAPTADPTPVDRVRGVGARLLGALPATIQRAAARSAPPVIDGQRLDPAVHALLELNPRPDAGPIVRTDVARARAQYRRDTIAIGSASASVAGVRDLTVDGAEGPLDARLYLPEGVDRPPLTVFFHGGGYVEGDLDTHDGPCRLLCRQAGHAVLSVAYRLAPEHPFPAAVDDVVAAFRWAQAAAARLGTDPDRVAVAGDSAGGALAAVVAQATREDRPPVAQLLVYPATDHPTHRPSRELFDGFLLRDAVRQAFFDVYTSGEAVADRDPRLSPIYGRLDGLAPALVVTAGFDVLRDEGEAYARALAEAGTRADLYRQADQPHGFLHLTAVSRSAERATVALARRWRQMVGGA